MFYIIEQGARIQTPLEKLLKPETVPQIQASAAIQRIGSEHEISNTQQSAQKAYQQDKEHTEQQPQPAIFAGQIMTQPAHCLAMDASIDQAWLTFEKNRFHHLPITNQAGALCGLISDRDLLRYAVSNKHDNKLGSKPVSQIMHKAVITAAINTEIRTIAEVMTQRSFGLLPIVNEQQQVEGVVSRSDILRTLVKQANVELWA